MAGQPHFTVPPPVSNVHPLPHAHVVDAFFVPVAHALVGLKAVSSPHLLYARLRMNKHKSFEIHVYAVVVQLLQRCRVGVGQ